MSNVCTAAQIKGKSTCPKRDAPHPGTKIGDAYALFMANKGVPVVLDLTGRHGSISRSLTDDYGLDIRQVQRKSTIFGRQPMWLLAGQWFGRVYIDYTQKENR